MILVLEQVGRLMVMRAAQHRIRPEAARRRHWMASQHASRLDERCGSRRVIVGSGPRDDRIEMTAGNIYDLGVHGSLQRGDDVRRLAAECPSRLEPLILRLVPE